MASFFCHLGACFLISSSNPANCIPVENCCTFDVVFLSLRYSSRPGSAVWSLTEEGLHEQDEVFKLEICRTAVKDKTSKENYPTFIKACLGIDKRSAATKGSS